MIKVLEVNNIDLPGKSFNGYNMILDLKDKNISIKQAVIIKQSQNDNVVKILNNESLNKIYDIFEKFESKNSIHNLFSITSPALMDLESYKESDLIHFHMFHNTKLSIPSLLEIAKTKKLIITLHDPWFLTGRCVHFYDCNKWREGCYKCSNLNSLFPFLSDNCHEMWKIKKYVFDNIKIDIVVTSKWMYDLVKTSPILKNQNNIHFIPLGIDYAKFNVTISKENARKHFNISKKNIVLFLRAQNEFKGTEYILDALCKLKVKENITILTCDEKDLLNKIKNKFQIIDLGSINENEVSLAMRACDIFLMPSKAESFGMMAVEAMSCSRPVIIFNNTALPSVTHAPNCGYIVKNRDANELCRAIKYLIENPEEREKRGQLGRKICSKYYSYGRYNEEIKKMYKEIYKRPNANCDINISTNYDNVNFFTKLMIDNLKNKILKNKFSYFGKKTGLLDKVKLNFNIDDVIYINEFCNKIYNMFSSSKNINFNIKTKIKNKLNTFPKIMKIIKRFRRKK